MWRHIRDDPHDRHAVVVVPYVADGHAGRHGIRLARSDCAFPHNAGYLREYLFDGSRCDDLPCAHDEMPSAAGLMKRL